MPDNPSLKDLLVHVADQIEAAAAERAAGGKQPLLRASSATIELNVLVGVTKEGKGGFDIKVISLGGSRASQEQHVHKITVGLSGLTREEVRSGTFLPSQMIMVDKLSEVAE